MYIRMKREIDLKEVSDGKLYTANDMVKIGCNDCAGCSECCRVVGDSIILDPYDIYQLETGLQTDFAALMKDKIGLNVVDGIILPHLKMRQGKEGCVFLNEEGRCGIHNYRPGFCRMFPMGRIYEEDGFRYFLQVHECAYPNKTKIKLKKWIGIPELSSYEQYIKDWHDFLMNRQELIRTAKGEETVKALNMQLLNQFFVMPYEGKDFYGQFYQRLSEIQE